LARISTSEGTCLLAIAAAADARMTSVGLTQCELCGEIVGSRGFGGGSLLKFSNAMHV
jgi:hypothetical protein